jgi:hypothetical protein
MTACRQIPANVRAGSVFILMLLVPLSKFSSRDHLAFVRTVASGPVQFRLPTNVKRSVRYAHRIGDKT